MSHYMIHFHILIQCHIIIQYHDIIQFLIVPYDLKLDSILYIIIGIDIVLYSSALVSIVSYNTV